MRAIIKKYELKEYVASKGANKGQKFRILKVTVETKDDKGVVKTYHGSLGEQYAKDYFAYCGVKTVDTIGKECDVSLQRRTYTDGDGNEHRITEIKFFNLLDDNGNAIIKPKDNSSLDIKF